MVKCNILSLVVIAALIFIGGCPEKESGEFRELFESDFGISVSFGMSPSQVQGELGAPTVTKELQGGASVEEYYLAEGVDLLAADEPYTSFTYHYGKLVRVGNRYFPETDSENFPPFFPEPLPGVKLGARRSAFVDALGEVEKGGTGESWRISGAAGEMITIKAWFTDVTSVGDSQCSIMSVTFASKVEIPRGEAFKDKK